MPAKLISSIAIIMGVLIVAGSLVILVPDSNVYAWELVGDNTGLRLVPSETPLFDLQNMYPGDLDTATIRISNKDDQGRSFTASLRIEKTGGSEKADLYEQLLLTVVYEHEEKFKDVMSKFEGLDLGSFAPDTSKELELTVELPGPETGNEFQGATLDINLIFTAEGESAEEPGGPGEPQWPGPFVPPAGGNFEIPEEQDPFTEPEEELVVEPEPPEGSEWSAEETEEQVPEDVIIIDPEAPEGRGELPRTDGGGFIGLIAGIALISLGLILRKTGEVKA
ncbi:MAG: hypothetical protein GX197_05830 [Firmicutes bacterium]|nr:hypothetical protein [Bacillota bacterium]